MQPPPPGFSPWGPPPDHPREHNDPAFSDPAFSDPAFSAQPIPESYGQQPPLPAYGGPTPGYPPQAGYGSAPWVGYNAQFPTPTSQQKIGWITFAIVGLLGLLGAVLSLTLWINLDSTVDRAAQMCDRFSGEYARACRQSIKHLVPEVPVALVVCLVSIIAANLAATGGAVMLFLKKQLGQFLILGGGIVMVVLSIGCEARYGATSRLTYDLIAGVVVTVISSLMFVPAFRILLGLPPKLTVGPVPGGGQTPQYGPPGPPPQQW